MPIYEYRCQKCGHQLEKLQRIGAEPLLDCPECKTAALKRVISASGFRLAGGGWYETDFKTGDKKNLAGGKSADSNKSAGKSAGNKTAGDK